MESSTPETLLTIRDLHKKFCKDIRYNLMHGTRDMMEQAFGLESDYMVLRKKEFWSLSGIELDVREGDILAVIGANGSGKTTLMRLISGIYPIQQGDMHFQKDTRVTPIFALRSGMHPLFTGRENINIKGAMYGMTRKQIDEKMDFIVEFSDLGDFLDMPLGNYSSGMKARLAYTVAIATDPNIFIIDEALAVGDSMFKAKCFDHLHEFVKQPRRAVIFVSNHIHKVLRLANRVAILDKGKKIFESSDIPASVDYYMNNCLGRLDEKSRKHMLDRVKYYEL